MYLPLGEDQAETELPIFYGAINIYLKQVFPFLKRMPAFLQKALNSDRLLRFAGKLSGSTKAQGNEAMTISMLKEPRVTNEDLDELIRVRITKTRCSALSTPCFRVWPKRWLRTQMCRGLTLQDEDEWMNAMGEP